MIRTDQQKLTEIAVWCRLWLDGETDPKYTQELIAGIERIALGKSVKISELAARPDLHAQRNAPPNEAA